MNVAAVRRALLEDAEADAGRLLAAAEAEAAERLAGARREAEGRLRAARAEGEADALAQLGAERARARREARERILAARREAYEALGAAAADAARALRDDPSYPDLRAALVRRAQAQLGPDAEILDDPEGGIIARDGNRRVDYRLVTLAGRCLDAFGEEVEALWC